MSSVDSAEPAYSPSLWTAGGSFPTETRKGAPSQNLGGLCLYPKPFAPNGPVGVCKVAWGGGMLQSQALGMARVQQLFVWAYMHVFSLLGS